MSKLRKMVVLGLIAVLMFGSSLAESGYIEQIIEIDDGLTKHNIIVTDWSKLTPLQGTSEEELSIFRCMIAAQMLDPGMTKEKYLKYLNKKGIFFELVELEGPFTMEGKEPVCYLVFSKRVSLFLVGNPITVAWISLETPFEVGGYADVPVDINNTVSPYMVLTEDLKYVVEPYEDTETTP